MTNEKVYTAIGLMSGTSLDGVDAALIRTDGHGFVEPLGFHSVPYEEGLRGKLRACLGRSDRDAADIREAEREMTQVHSALVGTLSKGVAVDIVGFHGQTIFHNPEDGVSVQLGDAELLARETGIDVVHDFRSADMRAGGQGAPFLPLYHRARAAAVEKPVAILNIGGVGNVTWIGAEDILAFDTGPGNALIDDFVRARTGQRFDEGGALAASGYSVDALLEKWHEHPYFKQRPPKSLDRNAWDVGDLSDLSDADGAATLAMFTVQTIVAALDYMPETPRAWYVTGGGRKNEMIMGHLRAHLKNLAPVEDIGWNGDALEAEGFAYLAVRSLLGLPLSVPGTTGVREPVTGGVLYQCAS